MLASLGGTGAGPNGNVIGPRSGSSPPFISGPSNHSALLTTVSVMLSCFLVYISFTATPPSVYLHFYPAHPHSCVMWVCIGVQVSNLKSQGVISASHLQGETSLQFLPEPAFMEVRLWKMVNWCRKKRTVDVYCGDKNLFTESHCEDSPNRKLVSESLLRIYEK